ncbi:MAG: gamma-glutamyl hercynylcysteine S-oxide synthase, partial [Chloroflexota bacterium]|nr:gamma-glutamyl hercynylcysteine S-oxide synthase [Chloroflexota bacterium]
MIARLRQPADADARKRDIAARLADARARTYALLAPLSDVDMVKQHNPLMSPPGWDLAHIGNFEELWLVQTLGELPPIDPAYDDMYDAFKHPRRERDQLPILDRDQAEEYLGLVRSLALKHLREADL